MPPFVSVKVCGDVPPTTTFPKAKLPGLAISVAFDATPLPESKRVCGEPGALSVKIILPDTPPLVVGANCTLKDRLWPAVRVAGKERPFIVKPVPESVARFTTTFTFPLFVSFTACEVLWPNVMFPKLSEAGEIANPACVPVPVRETVKGELAASLAIVRLPVTAPPDGGANWI